MDPIMQAVYFGRADELIREKNPNEEEQIPAKQDDVISTRHNYQLHPTEENGQAYVNALRQAGHHDEADDFAFKNLKKKPKFTISEGF
jgi:hypothetical protein